MEYGNDIFICECGDYFSKPEGLIEHVETCEVIKALQFEAQIPVPKPLCHEVILEGWITDERLVEIYNNIIMRDCDACLFYLSCNGEEQ